MAYSPGKLNFPWTTSRGSVELPNQNRHAAEQCVFWRSAVEAMGKACVEHQPLVQRITGRNQILRSGRRPVLLRAGQVIFPNDASITRLVGAMMLEQNDEWSLNRRYMQLEGLQTLCDTPPTRLSAVAR